MKTEVSTAKKSASLRKILSLLSVFAIGLLGWTQPTNPVVRGAASSNSPAFSWPTITLNKYATGLSMPTALTNAGDGSGRLFALEQAGQIRIIKNGSVLSTPFLDISGKTKANGEEGLLGLAFPPGYNSKGHFYIYYTNLDGNNILARYRVSSNPDTADPNSEEILLTLLHPTYPNHNGGQLAFGPDGYLYVGVGDGGGGGDPNNNAQNLGTLLGKILRIDVEAGAKAANTPSRLPAASNLIYLPFTFGSGSVPSSSGASYFIPASNPFINTSGALPEIWAYGLRNPWRFSFDRQTGDLYIADVGQDTMEEIDFQPAGSPGGQNYGWNILEGILCYPSGQQGGCTPPSNYVPPVATYYHGTNDSNGCSVTGGYVYRGQTYPALQGIYFYGDYCSGRIWGLVNAGGWQTQELAHPTISISTFGQDEAGNLYVADYATGDIYLITGQ